MKLAIVLFLLGLLVSCTTGATAAPSRDSNTPRNNKKKAGDPSESGTEEQQPSQVPGSALPSNSDNVAAVASMPPATLNDEAESDDDGKWPMPDWVKEISNDLNEEASDEYLPDNHYRRWIRTLFDDVVPNLDPTQRSVLMRTLMFSASKEAYEYAVHCMLEFEAEQLLKEKKTADDQHWKEDRKAMKERFGSKLTPEDCKRLQNTYRRLSNNSIKRENEKLKQEYKQRCKKRLRRTCKRSSEYTNKWQRPTFATIAAIATSGISKKAKEEDDENQEEDEEEDDQDKKPRAAKKRKKDDDDDSYSNNSEQMEE